MKEAKSKFDSSQSRINNIEKVTMATCSENVLLQIPQVRYKKGDGTLFVMDNKITWMLKSRNNFTISHLYQDIKGQKISAVGKSKVQLQLILHNGMSTIFHFVNRDGLQAQSADRNRVKEFLQTLLSKFKRKYDKELEDKNNFLSSNPTILQLYKDLVTTQVVTSEEFWTQHATNYIKALTKQNQEIGVSAAFLADIKPQTDGCNGLKYNITGDTIESIFKTYPAVRKKFKENVPNKITEKDFWTKFFQSHYFHKDRIIGGNKDIFTECGKLDDQQFKKEIQTGINNPFVDIVNFDDKADDIFEAYSEKNTKSWNFVHQSMIRRCNQQSIMVLKSCENQAPCEEEQIIQINKKQLIKEKVTYEDLNTTQEKQNSAKSQLYLTKVERYAQPPYQVSLNNLSNADVLQINQQIQNEVENWKEQKCSCPLINSTTALNALRELSPGGALMQEFQEQSSAHLISEDIKEELRSIYFGLLELLRYFWSSFPPTTPALEQKAINMHQALQRYHAAKLKPFEDKILREQSQSLTTHLNKILMAAFEKFNAWQQRKAQILLR